jgi:hypothetical protein
MLDGLDTCTPATQSNRGIMYSLNEALYRVGKANLGLLCCRSIT